MALWTIYSRVLRQLRPERALATFLAFANVLLSVAAFAEPLLFGRIIDSLLHEEQATRSSTLIWIWVLAGLTTIVASVTVALHADRMAHRRRAALVRDYFEHALTLPIAFHTATHSGRVMKTMIEGSTAMWRVWLSFFREHCATFVTLLVLLPATLFLNPWMGSVLIGLVVLFGSLITWVTRKTEDKQMVVEAIHGEMSGRAADALSNLPVVQSFTRIPEETRALARLLSDFLDAQMPVLSLWAFVAAATRIASTLAVLSLFLVGVHLHSRGQCSVGEIVTFTSFATLVIGRLEQTIAFVHSVFMQAPVIREFFQTLDTVSELPEPAAPRDPATLIGSVRFENVTFSYDGKRNAVENLNFEVRPGETIALVGATGSGKSTTLSLLFRTYDPNVGSVRIDGIDLRDLSLSYLRRHIGVVFQDPMLFARTLRENLSIGNPEATDQQIHEALRRAQAEDIVAQQPLGLDTVIGERGRTLSGGERQRLSIARALLKDPPILILDEATSALDANTEALVQQALDAAKEGRTTFVIAHRLSTIKNADRILVFEQGRLVEGGNFAELVRSEGRFARLALAQGLISPPSSSEEASTPRAPVVHSRPQPSFGTVDEPSE